MGQTTFRIMRDSLLVNLAYGDLAWGDYDGDGDFDLVVTGNLQQTDDPAPLTQIFQYDGDQIFPGERGGLIYVSFFTEAVTLPGVWQSTTAWGDYDNDGDLDLFIAGLQADGTPLAQIYENSGNGAFTLYANLTGVYSGDAAWGDYDNDGDLDLLVAGIESDGPYRSVIYENQAGSFTRRDVGLVGVAYASVQWGDYDADGDIDILLAGTDAGQAAVLKVYRNEGQRTFVDAEVNIDGLAFPSVDWGDYDNDGDLDIVLNGGKYSPFVFEGVVRRYRNEAGVFVRVPGELLGGYYGGVSWGDYNNDGLLDVLAFGGFRPNALVQGNIYRNEGSESVSSVATFTGGFFGSAIWGDYDGDGDLDFALLGQRSGGLSDVIVHRNDLHSENPPPSVPTGLQAVPQDGSVVLSWEAPPGEGLSYNLRVGTTPGSADVISPMALPTGRRLLSARGNAGHRLQWELRLPPGRFYWSVQALNAGYTGSAFAAEQSFTTGDVDDMTPPARPSRFTARSEDGQVVLTWDPNTEPDLARYLLYRGPTPDAEMLVASVRAGTETYTDTGVENGETYYYRLQAQDESGNLSALTDAQVAVPNLRFTIADMTDLPSSLSASIAWGDYDADGDPDLILSGSQESAIYRNDDGVFSHVQDLSILGNLPSVDWGDYDNDGDLDLVIAGSGVFAAGRIIIYRNDEGMFFSLEATLPNLADGQALWGDYDADGDLDLLIAGRASNGTALASIYRNDNGTFVDSGIELTGGTGVAAWGDYDADGDLDLIITNFSEAPDIYRNEGGSFVGIANVATNQAFATAWGDYDNDGDLDLVVADRNGTRLYRNDDGSFVDVQIDFPILNPNAIDSRVQVAWADYDNDGKLDLVLAGIGFTELYHNTDTGFVLEEDNFVDFGEVTIDWGDYDNDGDLDLLMSGRLFTNLGNRTILYQNNTTF